MPLDQDDILLGEKLDYYCSSSDDDLDRNTDNENDNDTNDENNKMQKGKLSKLFKKPDSDDDNPFSEQRKRAARIKRGNDGRSQFTGPKGVISDESAYRKELRAQQLQDELDEKNAGFEAEDQFFQEYRKQRLLQLKQQYSKETVINAKLAIDLKNGGIGLTSNDVSRDNALTSANNLPQNIKSILGKYSEISFSEYTQLLNLIEIIKNNSHDKKTFSFTILFHLYDDAEFLCDIIDDCLDSIAKRLSSSSNTFNNLDNFFIFCKIRAADMGSTLSEKFMAKGIPAIQIYKNEELALATVKLEIEEKIGCDFTMNDFFNFLRRESKVDLF